MCAEVPSKYKYFSFNVLLAIGTFLGILAGWANTPLLNGTAEVISEIFMNLLKLVSLPIIFLSIVSTASKLEGMHEVRSLGFKVAKYTFLTTIIAATIALGLFVFIDPVNAQAQQVAVESVSAVKSISFSQHFINVVPGNILEPFVSNNVIGVLFIAMGLSFAILALPEDQRKPLHTVFSSLYSAVMKIVIWVVSLMPIAIFGFMTLCVRDLRQGEHIKSIGLYLACVVAANIIQAVLVLPALLKSKGIPPIKTFKAMFPALSVAFFSKSSSGALPMAMSCAEKNAGVSRKVASFSLPLCTTINMNGCAAFILTTVLFVSMSNGVTYTAPEMVGWIFIATIAAIGNAGIPMGCYTLSAGFLAAMNVDPKIMGIILPFYAMIDMLESAINVWSDSCVAVIVDKEMKEVPVLNPEPVQA